MAVGQHFGVGGVPRKVKNKYIGIGGVARKVKEGLFGVGGVARKFYAGETTIVTSGTGGFNSSGVVTFDSVVPAFTRAVVWIDVPDANRAIYYPNGNYTGKTFVVPWGPEGEDADNPVVLAVFSDGGTSSYYYEYYDGEGLNNVSLQVTVTRSTLSAKFVIHYTDDDDDHTERTGYCPLTDGEWSVTFTCEGD